MMRLVSSVAYPLLSFLTWMAINFLFYAFFSFQMIGIRVAFE
jgi:hypothetical protein